MLKTQHKKLSVCKLLIVAVVGMLAVIFFVTANAQTIPLSACSLSANNCTYPLQHILQPGQTLSSGCTGGGGMCTTVTLPTYAPPPCTASLPNLRISGLSIGEQRLSSWSRAANVTQLDPRERYSLVASVQNASCRAVSSGAVRTEERCSTRTYGNTRYRSLGGSEYWVDRYRSNPDVTVATTATSTLVTTCRDVRVGFTEPPYSETRGNFPATL